MKSWSMQLSVLFLIIQFPISLRAECDGGYIKRNGYLIHFGVYGWFFQPCDSANITFLESLNSSSFHILYGTDGYNNALRTFEDIHFSEMTTDTVFYGKPLEDLSNVGLVRYKYIEMDYRNSFFSNIGTQNIPLCMIEFSIPSNEQKRYRLGCLWFECGIENIGTGN